MGIEPDEQTLKSFQFYAEKYLHSELIVLTPEVRLWLGDKESRVCRFCEKGRPEVSFRKVAHALPEALGVKDFRTYYECDSCNAFFGDGIENEFGKWSKPLRTFSFLSGKSGVPTLKGGGDGSEWRVERTPEGFAISHQGEHPIMVQEGDKNEMRLTIRRDSYTPVAVHKAFVKMALTLMPEEELPNFRDAMDWIRDPDHSRRRFKGAGVTMFRSPMAFNMGTVTAQLFARAPEVTDVPYFFMTLGFGNLIFQIIVPSREKDAGLRKIKLAALPLPRSPDPERYGDRSFEILDLSSHEKRVGEEFGISFTYEHMEKMVSEDDSSLAGDGDGDQTGL